VGPGFYYSVFGRTTFGCPFLVVGIVQGSGDEACHFYVHRSKDKGYVTLESALHRGIFVGMHADGRVQPIVDTGQRNVRFYPEVIQCKFVMLFE